MTVSTALRSIDAPSAAVATNDPGVSRPLGALRAAGRAANTAGLFFDVAGRTFASLDVAAERRRRSRAEALRHACQQALGVHGVVVDARGLFPDEPCIVVANHLSWLDPLVVASLLPVSPIAKHEVRRWPFVGPLCASLGCMFVERGSSSSGAQVLRAARRALDEGVSVLGFPEGTTRAFGAGLGPFHRGLFGLAARLRIPLVPVGLRYADADAHWVGDDGFVGHWARLSARPLTRVDVRVGQALRPLAGAPLGRFIASARAAVERLATAGGERSALSRWVA